MALHSSTLENPVDGGAWWSAVHGVAKSRTRLSNFTFTFQFHALEKEMATHSSALAWRIPGTGEPGGLPSMGSHRVGRHWSDLAAATGHTLSLCFILHNILTRITQQSFIFIAFLLILTYIGVWQHGLWKSKLLLSLLKLTIEWKKIIVFSFFFSL